MVQHGGSELLTRAHLSQTCPTGPCDKLILKPPASGPVCSDRQGGGQRALQCDRALVLIGSTEVKVACGRLEMDGGKGGEVHGLQKMKGRERDGSICRWNMDD